MDLWLQLLLLRQLRQWDQWLQLYLMDQLLQLRQWDQWLLLLLYRLSNLVLLLHP
jgi:hypothetical protein